MSLAPGARLKAGIVICDVEKKSYHSVADKGGTPVFLQDGRRIAFKDGNAVTTMDTASGRIFDILKGDSRRTIDAFGIAADGRSLYVSWASAQADLWLMEFGGQR